MSPVELFCECDAECDACRKERALREAARMADWRLLEEADALCPGCGRAAEVRIDHDPALVLAAEALRIYGCACP